ncbi:MAG: amidohydrolase [Deltaproteobacteria bacterium]|nr:amidohydrolase [Deltaproteobacteria bacterium]
MKRPKATLLLYNGRIFTSEDDQRVVSALAIAGDRILAAGSLEQLQGDLDDRTRRIDLKGRFVAPGFHDAHLHLQSAGRMLTGLNLARTKTLEAAVDAVAQRVKTTPEGQWIYGRGWDHTLWTDGRWPTRHDLDRVAPNHPVYLRRVDGHVAWANTAALTRAKIGRETPDPDGGVIERESGGQPSGLLKENAIELIKPEISLAQARDQLSRALNRARRLGVTSIQDGGSDIEALIALRRDGQLTARVFAWGELDQPLEKSEALRRQIGTSDGFLVFGALKGFVDGTLGSQTAALLEPYADGGKDCARNGCRGMLLTAEDLLLRRVKQAARSGFQVALHAIGDRAVEIALKAFAAAKYGPDGKPLRHRVEHAQVIAPTQIERFRQTETIASMQPCHFITDQRWVEKRLGTMRARERGYVWRSLLRAGVPLALGTDWPVEPLSPLRNLYAAVTRNTWPAGPRGLFEHETLTVGQALHAYTYGSAYSAGVEMLRGRLIANMDADLVVLDRDLLKIDPKELPQVEVLATMVGGRLVYGQF